MGVRIMRRNFGYQIVSLTTEEPGMVKLTELFSYVVQRILLTNQIALSTDLCWFDGIV